MEQHKISVTGPPDLLAVIPYQLGFHPARSVVVVCLHGKRMGLVVRLDAVADLAQASAAAASILRVLRREAPDGVMVIGYEDEPGQSASLSQAIAVGVALEHITLVDRIVVRGDRWVGLMCTCCPDEPVPPPYEVAAVATYVGLGRAALRSRDELAAVVRPLEPVPAGLSEAIDTWVGDVVESRALFDPPKPPPSDAHPDITWADYCLTAWADLLAGHFDGRDVPEEDLCLLLGSLRDRDVRDGIIALLCPGSLERGALDPGLVELLETYVAPVIDDIEERAEGKVGHWVIRSRLERLCRLAPEAHAAPVLTVAGAQAWYAGDGAAARVAIERALEVEPGHVLARLLAHLLELGIRPPGLAAA